MGSEHDARGVKFRLALLSLTRLAAKLHGTAIDAFWTGNAFLLTNTVSQPSWVSISDAFGRRAALLAGAALFSIGCIIGGAAQGFPQLLAGRAVQGLGGGSIMCLGEVIITDLVPLPERPKFIIYITSAWALGSLTGPVIGGAIIEHAMIGGIMAFSCLQLNQRDERPLEKLKRIDYIGSAIFTGSLTSLLIALTWGGVMYPWTSARTIAPLCVGIVGIIAFTIYEIYVARAGKSTVINVNIFKTTSACANFYNTFVHGMIMWLSLYYTPLYFEGAKLFGPVHAGVAYFPSSAPTVPVSIIASIIIKRRQKYSWAQWVGWPIATLGGGLRYLLDVQTTTVQWVFYQLVNAIGVGIIMPGTATANMAVAPTQHIAVAAGMVPFFRSFGQMMGLAIGSTIFQNQLKRELVSNHSLEVAAGQYAHDATAMVGFIEALPASPLKLAAQSAFADGLKPVWIFNCAIAGSAMLMALLIRGSTMNRKQVTEHGWVGATKTQSIELGILQKDGHKRHSSGIADAVFVAQIPWSQPDDSHSVWRRDLSPPLGAQEQRSSVQSKRGSRQ
ncbi:MAG: hypothetical protein Q9162_004348 [Coniocarpon cinnabarinum]